MRWFSHGDTPNHPHLIRYFSIEAMGTWGSLTLGNTHMAVGIMTKHAVKSVDLIFCHRLSSFCWSYRHAASLEVSMHFCFYPQCSWENGASKFVNGDFEDIEHSSESDVVHMPFLQA